MRETSCLCVPDTSLPQFLGLDQREHLEQRAVALLQGHHLGFNVFVVQTTSYGVLDHFIGVVNLTVVLLTLHVELSSFGNRFNSCFLLLLNVVQLEFVSRISSVNYTTFVHTVRCPVGPNLVSLGLTFIYDSPYTCEIKQN